MILHTLNASADAAAFRDCLAAAASSDAIVLMGDGVYAALPGTASATALADCPARVLALDTDVLAAGLEQRLGAFQQVDMDGLVALSEYYPRQVAWY